MLPLLCRTRFSAIIPLAAALLFCASAKADVIQNYNFSGTLTTPLNGNNSVSGQFSLDLTVGSISTFNFTTPIGTIDPASYAANLMSFVGTVPSGNFVEISFNNTGPAASTGLNLVFQTTLASFSGNTFSTGPRCLCDRRDAR